MSYRVLKPKFNIFQTFKNDLGTFSGAKRGSFFQNPPKITNQYEEDPFLREILHAEIPSEALADIEPDLHKFGARVSGDILDLHYETERIPPKLENYDAWGNRIDRIETCNAWKEMKNISATEGLISIPYEKKFGSFSRLYQVAKLYLFAPSSGLYTCPLAMTDGAAKSFQLCGIDSHTEEAFACLTSRDPKKFWTSGQWMTERRGGSDVSDGTETIAHLDNDKFYKLYGYKWFSSATDSDMTVTLARVADSDKKGLTMFYAKTRKEDGSLNSIEVHKLKNKLGTRQLPTAELLLDGTKAYRLSDIGKGVSKMSSMLTITRIHNSIWAVSNMRRVINLARDYATKRKAFGDIVINHELHRQTLGNLEVECRASLLTLMYVTKLLGKIENNEATSDESELLRFLTPLMKLYTAKQSIAVASEGLECFGGQGYIEDTGLPNLLRDAQVLSIWEGTTNILSLDALRSIQKSKGESMKIFNKQIRLFCEKGKDVAELEKFAKLILSSTENITSYLKKDPQIISSGAREFSFSLYRLFTASLILDKCIKSNMNPTDLFLLKKWCIQDLTPLVTNHKADIYTEASSKSNKDLFLNGHPSYKL